MKVGDKVHYIRGEGTQIYFDTIAEIHTPEVVNSRRESQVQMEWGTWINAHNIIRIAEEQVVSITEVGKGSVVRLSDGRARILGSLREYECGVYTICGQDAYRISDVLLC